MRYRLGLGLLAAIVAGIAAGVVMGTGMHVMMAPTPEGGQVPMIDMIGDIPLRYDATGTLSAYSKTAVGWVYHLFNSALIGGLFGLAFGSSSTRWRGALGWGLVYGTLWWILGGLTLMPLLLGMPAFAPLMMEPMRPVAVASLLGHLMYGLVLGLGFAWLYRALVHPEPVPHRVEEWREQRTR